LTFRSLLTIHVTQQPPIFTATKKNLLFFLKTNFSPQEGILLKYIGNPNSGQTKEVININKTKTETETENV
jgi:hypothetical protein